jgi:hypothetical protein
LFTPSVVAERERLRSRLQQLDSAYTSASTKLTIPYGASAWSKPLVAALQDAAPRHDEAMANLITLATHADAKFEPALAELDDADTQYRAAAAHLVADAGRVEDLLRRGTSPGEKSPDGAALASALDKVRSADLYKTDGVRQALEPLLSPVAVVERQNTPSAMRLLARQNDQLLGIRLAGWSRSAADVSRDTLPDDVATADALLKAAQASVPDKARVDSIKSRLEADVLARWKALLDGGRSDADVAAALALRDKVASVEPTRLPPRARFNLALADLRRAVAAAKGDAADKSVAPAAQELKRAAANLDPADPPRVPQVATVLTEVERLGRATPTDVTVLGPAAAAGGKVAWSPFVEPDGQKVTYRALLTTDAGKEDVTLVFRRVKPTAAGPASWVCTTETSMGLFADLITAAGRWNDVRAGRLLTEYEPDRGGGGDPRKGPRVWEWPRYARAPGITWTRQWLSPDYVPAGADHYPPPIVGDYNYNPTQIGSPATQERAPELNPSRRQPMQYVSAKAAMLAASLAGCRLPTAAEWQAANASTERAIGVNCRDATWRLELDHMRRPTFKGQCRPDAGMFTPAGEQISDDVARRDDGAAFNDHILWFREVPPAPSVFVDLVGNVGEFVTDADGKVCVIGGSALAPPKRPVDRPFPLTTEQLAAGFSDVGFRLAFSEPAPGVDKLKDAVAGNWYLTAK